MAISRIGSNLITDATIATADIAADAITTAKIAAGTIITTDLADDAITAAKLAANAVVTASIVAGSVDTTELAADAVTGAKIADDAIDSEHIVDGSIDTAHMSDNAVTVAKMADLARGQIIAGNAAGNPVALAVGSANTVLKTDGTDISYGTIATANIAADAVTTAKIGDDQVTLDKMAGLARGKIIYGNSSGNPTALALGTSGQALTSDGTDISWGQGGKTTEEIQDLVGAMFTSNTETNVTVTYQDGDGTIDVVGSAAIRTILRVLARAGSFIDCTVTDATLPVTARSGTVTVRKVSLPVQVIPQVTYR